MCRAPAMAAALMTGSSAMDVGSSIMQPALAVAGSAMLGARGSAAMASGASGAVSAGMTVVRAAAAARPSKG